jgi:3-deoxy-D-manno-octulosonic-acid transferase
MSVSGQAYRLLSTGLALSGLPAFYLYSRVTGKYADGLAERLGRYPGDEIRRLAGRPRIWMHAVSVGEVAAAAAIARALADLIPESATILSTTTETGQAAARKMFGPAAVCLYAPIDAPFAVGRALKTVRPDLLAFCETEIWPHWLDQARQSGVKTALVNGRISPRSFRRYRRIRPFIGPVLARLQVFSMISASDAARIRQMGADAARIRINGNAKYDGLIQRTAGTARDEMARLLGLGPQAPVLVAGSIRGPELRAVVDAFCRIRADLPEAVLIAAPRHLDNAAPLIALAAERGLAAQRRSALLPGAPKRTAPVVVLDTIGELMAVYGVASVVFCGGSLVPLGGQNLLEPAAWGKPVLYGPSTDDFADARQLLERHGGGEAVADAGRLAERGLYYLSRPAAAAATGRRAIAAAMSQSGAGRRHAKEMVAVLRGGAGTDAACK